MILFFDAGEHDSEDDAEDNGECDQGFIKELKVSRCSGSNPAGDFLGAGAAGVVFEDVFVGDESCQD